MKPTATRILTHPEDPLKKQNFIRANHSSISSINSFKQIKRVWLEREFPSLDRHFTFAFFFFIFYIFPNRFYQLPSRLFFSDLFDGVALALVFWIAKIRTLSIGGGCADSHSAAWRCWWFDSGNLCIGGFPENYLDDSTFNESLFLNFSLRFASDIDLCLLIVNFDSLYVVLIYIYIWKNSRNSSGLMMA